MLQRNRVTWVLIILSGIALGAWFPPTAYPFTLTGFGGGGGWSHEGIEVNCTYTGETGTVTANPGTDTLPATWMLNAPGIECTGLPKGDATCPVDSVCTGVFDVNLTYTFPSGSVCDEDPGNAGIGNNTCRFDLQNPVHNTGSTTTNSSVSCDNNPNGATRTYSAFCENGMTVSGTLTWRSTAKYPNPPIFVTLAQTEGSTCQNGDQSCVMNLGGWVYTKKGNVDPTACDTAFPGVTGLAQDEVLHYTEFYPEPVYDATKGIYTCAGHVNPGSPVSRSCETETFVSSSGDSQNLDCNPVKIPGGTDYHTFPGFGGAGTGTTEIALTTGQWQPNNTINLKCNGGSDNGQIPTTIVNSSVFDAGQVYVDLQSTPEAMVDGYDGDTSPVYAWSLQTDSSGNTTGMKLSFLSCRTGDNGLAQVMCRHQDKWTMAGATSATVVLRLRGKTKGGTDGSDFTGVTLPVSINSTDACPD